MANIIDYLMWRGDLDFSQSPFNEIDNLIFSQIIYVDFSDIVSSESEGITIEKAFFKFTKKYKKKEIEKKLPFLRRAVELFQKMSETNRFSNLKLKYFVQKTDYEIESQFSAITIELDEFTDYICYRGTDDTIIGWKENFNMSYTMPVPAQIEAVNYIEKVGENNKNLILGGHSKGGNLAVYAAVKCKDSIKKRIIKVFNNDGPGFSQSMIENDDYKEIASRIETFLPQSSLVGILLDHDEEYKVIKSKQISIMQHNADTWEVMGAEFIRLNDITDGSKRMDSAVKSWLSGLNNKQREEFVEALFSIFGNNDIKTIEDMINDKWEIIKSIKNMDDETKKVVFDTLFKLFQENNKLLKESIIEKLPIKK